MKFKVTMKDPDVLHEAVFEAVKNDLLPLPISEEERELLVDGRMEKVHQACRQWFSHGEYLTVEIDTEAKTATVCNA